MDLPGVVAPRVGEPWRELCADVWRDVWREPCRECSLEPRSDDRSDTCHHTHRQLPTQKRHANHASGSGVLAVCDLVSRSTGAQVSECVCPLRCAGGAGPVGSSLREYAILPLTRHDT
jgi:hypothetical protein